MFGKEARDGILIDLKITNDDIAGFCGISTRHSVNRILRGLREEHVIRTLYNKNHGLGCRVFKTICRC